jgi:hypothetical protein
MVDEIIQRTTALYRKDTTQREDVDVNAVIREMAVLLQQEAAAHAITIRTALADGLPVVIADRVQLQQVLMNLMLNAIEAMKDTGGEVTIKSATGEPGELLMLISVSDTGVGLPTDTPDTIFDAFVTTKPQGTGMGRAWGWPSPGRLWMLTAADCGRGPTSDQARPFPLRWPPMQLSSLKPGRFSTGQPTWKPRSRNSRSNVPRANPNGTF